MKTNLMECHQGKQEKGGDEQDGLLLEMALIAVSIGIFKVSTAKLRLVQPRDENH